MSNRIDAAIIATQIAQLRLIHPELVEDEDAWLLSLESETEAIEALRSIERKRQESTHLAGAIAANIAELELRQSRFERREKAMRELAFKIMQAADVRKIELPEATMSVRSGGVKLVIPDDAAVPDDFCRIKKEPNRAVIKDGLQSGAIAPNWATLVQSDETLSIRTK